MVEFVTEIGHDAGGRAGGRRRVALCDSRWSDSDSNVVSNHGRGKWWDVVVNLLVVLFAAWIAFVSALLHSTDVGEVYLLFLEVLLSPFDASILKPDFYLELKKNAFIIKTEYYW